MSYCYTIVPKESYEVIRNCSGCGTKSHYSNSGCFRVNANGNRVDVWLIYRCRSCSHTLNLTVFERVRPGAIPSDTYRKFLENDDSLAGEYGVNRDFFAKNKAVIADDAMLYQIIREESEEDHGKEEDRFYVHNPSGLPVREERILCEILQMSRSQVKKMLQAGVLFIEKKTGTTVVYHRKTE